jgi:predicted metalloprotease
VQTLLGTEEQVRSAQQRASEGERNALQVKMELQADCYAGVWAKNADTARHILEQGDVEEALQAASAVGDDTIQKRTQGYIVPDSFTHGTSAQRVSWFKKGLETGSVQACDTFSR